MRIISMMLAILFAGCNRPIAEIKPAPLDTTQREEVAVRKALEDYRAALLAEDGDAAVAVINHQTLRWYGVAVKQALDANANMLRHEKFVRKMTVLRLRHQFKRSELETMSGADAFAEAVRLRWVSRGAVENMELVRVEIKHHKALLYFKRAPQQVGLIALKEDGKWKISLLGVLNRGREIFGDARSSRLSDEQLILNLLDHLSSKTIDRRILDGPLD